MIKTKTKRRTIIALGIVLILLAMVLPRTRVLAAEETFTVEGIDMGTNNEPIRFSVLDRPGTNINVGRRIPRIIKRSDGSTVFCLEPGVVLSDGKYLSQEALDADLRAWISANAPTMQLSQENLNLIERIVYHGWETSGQEPLDYAATQVVLWEKLWNLSLNNSVYQELEDKMDSLEAKVDTHYLLPNLSGSNYDAASNTLTIYPGETSKLTDSSGLIGGMELISNDTGIKTSLSGNKISLTADNKSKNGTLKFRKHEVKNVHASIVYFNISGEDGQRLGDLGDPSNAFFSLNVRMRTRGVISFTKTNELGANLDGAEFKLSRDGADVGIKQVSPGVYTRDVNSNSSFTTHNGKVLIQDLETGIYTITETKSTNGFVLNSKPVQVQVQDEQTAQASMQNQIGKAKIRVLKSSEDNVLAGLKFKLSGTDILGRKVEQEATTNSSGVADFGQVPVGSYTISEFDLPLRYVQSQCQNISITNTTSQDIKFHNAIKKGSLKLTKTDSATAETIAGVTFGLFSTEQENPDIELASFQGVTDENGSLEIKDIEFGTWYLYELDTPLAYVSNGEPSVITVDKHEQVIELTRENHKTITEISKTDIAGKEISGAEMAILDDEGNLIESWVSQENETHIVRGLERGKRYILRESLAPLGYVLSQDVEFIVEEDGSVNKVSMINELTKTEILKTDTDGNVLVGAHLELYNSNDELIDSWISTEEAHFVRGLFLGETYILREVQAPAGYVISEDIEFTVAEDGSVNTIVMENAETTTEFRKTNKDGKLIPGAHLELYNTDDELIDSWISTEEAHLVRGLLLGETYILKEVQAPAGYVLSEAIEFIVAEDGSVNTVSMINELTQTEILKTDTDGNVLAGAHLELYNSDNELIDSWVSTEEAHLVRGLLLGETYILREVQAPAGYVISENIEFTVAKDGSVNTIVMENAETTTEIRKTNKDGKLISGAHLELYNSDNELIDSWISTEEAHILNGLVLSETYTIKEIQAPDGYDLGEDLSFTLSENNQIVELVNHEIMLVLSESGESSTGVSLAITFVLIGLGLLFVRSHYKKKLLN